MDLKWLILVINFAVLTVQISGSLKKKKRADSMPRVDHVSRTLASSLASKDHNSINRLTSQQHTLQTKTSTETKKKPKRTIKELRRLIAKRKHIKNPIKRKRVLRRLRKELAKLKRKRRSHSKRCKSSLDCDPDECCLKKFTLKGKGRCKKRPKLKQRCRPALLPGLDIECPCRVGLTCSPFKRSDKGYFKYRCEKVQLPEGEIDPLAVTGLNRF